MSLQNLLAVGFWGYAMLILSIAVVMATMMDMGRYVLNRGHTQRPWTVFAAICIACTIYLMQP